MQYGMTFDEKRGMGALNFGRYSSKTLDTLVEGALNQPMRAEEFQKAMFEAARIAMRDKAIMPLHWQVALWGMTKNLDYVPRADEYTLAHHFSMR